MNINKHKEKSDIVKQKIKLVKIILLICVLLALINFLFIKSSLLYSIAGIIFIFYLLYTIILLNYINILQK